MYTNIPPIHADNVKCNMAKAQIQDNYPEAAWTHVYTDGSSAKGVSNGEAGVIFKQANVQITR